jgi:hypothetical protein
MVEKKQRTANSTFANWWLEKVLVRSVFNLTLLQVVRLKLLSAEADANSQLLKPLAAIPHFSARK